MVDLSTRRVSLVHAAASFVGAGCVGAWLWLGEAPAACIWGTTIVLAIAASAHLVPWRAAHAASGPLLLASTLWALERLFRPGGWRAELPAGDLHWTRLAPTGSAHAALGLSMIGVGSYLLWMVVPVAAPWIDFVRCRIEARLLVLYVGLFLTLWTAANLFSIDHGTGFRYSRARFHPFLAFDIPGSYMYRHASERVVADTRGVSFQQNKPHGTRRIVLAGASTVWGHGLPAADSLSARLQEALDQMDPGAHYEVVMVAFPGKFQLNELIDASVTLPHWSPDLVVSLNGWNELSYGEAFNSYEGMPYIAPQVDLTLSVDPVAAWFYQNTFLGSVFWKRRLAREGLADKPLVDDPVPYEPPRYFFYLRSTARTLGEFGIPYASSLCPNQHEMPDHTGGDDMDRKASERRHAARAVVEGERQIGFSVMELLRGHSTAELFLDVCHFNAHGTRILAGALARHIPDWLALAKSRHGPGLDRLATLELPYQGPWTTRPNETSLSDSNLLVNPGFEEVTPAGMPSGWVPYGQALLVQDAARTHSGRVAIRAGGSDGFSQAVGVRAAARYTIGHFTRADLPEQYARLQVNWLDEKGRIVDVSINVVPASTRWAWHQVTVTAPPGAATAVVYVSVHEKSQVFFDDLSFAPGFRPPPA